MKKTITVSRFCDELISRIDKNSGIDCCREEIKKLATLAKQHLADRQIEVNWKDNN